MFGITCAQNNIAEPLSRLVITDTKNLTFDNNVEHYCNLITMLAKPTAIQMVEIEEFSATDETILAVKNGLYKHKWNDKALPFKLFETELCCVRNMLLRGNRIAMPESLRKRTIELAHEGHPGITMMKRRLRLKVWWPKIDYDAEMFVKNCHGCTMVSTSPPEPIRRKELPSGPWSHVAMDFLGPLPSGHNLLVIVDYYSRFIEIEILKKIDSFETIKCLRKIFARFGFPEKIIADNGRQFISDKFKSYCKENNIELINTTPYWPQQNGEVERQNRSILKRLIISQNQQSENKKQDLQEYLHMYRPTPHSTTLRTPSELMFGRTIRDKLPNINQPIILDEELRDRDRREKEKGKQYADKRRHAKPSELKEGDKVWLKPQIKSNKLTLILSQ